MHNKSILEKRDHKDLQLLKSRGGEHKSNGILMMLSGLETLAHKILNKLRLFIDPKIGFTFICEAAKTFEDYQSSSKPLDVFFPFVPHSTISFYFNVFIRFGRGLLFRKDK